MPRRSVAPAAFLVALGLALEAGFLLQVAVPPREVIVAARQAPRAEPVAARADAPPAQVARARDGALLPRS